MTRRLIGQFVYCMTCRKVTKLEEARQLGPDQPYVCQRCDPERSDTALALIWESYR